MTSSAGVAKGCSDHRFCAPPDYTAQLLALHQHRANDQYRVSSTTQAPLEQSPIQVLTELNVAWLQWLYENWYFQVDKPLRQIWECFYFQIINIPALDSLELQRRLDISRLNAERGRTLNSDRESSRKQGKQLFNFHSPGCCSCYRNCISIPIYLVCAAWAGILVCNCFFPYTMRILKSSISLHGFLLPQHWWLNPGHILALVIQHLLLSLKCTNPLLDGAHKSWHFSAMLLSW